jgi:hypothetical protein
VRCPLFTKDLEDALFDRWIRPANVKRYSIGHNVNSTFDIGLPAKPLNVELASEAFVAICLLRCLNEISPCQGVVAISYSRQDLRPNDCRTVHCFIGGFERNSRVDLATKLGATLVD